MLNAHIYLTFRNNSARPLPDGGEFDPGNGGAIIIEDAGNAIFLRSNFVSNSCQKDGGAVTFDSILNLVTIDSCTFELNTSLEEGGAVDYDAGSGDPNPSLLVTSSNFTNNTSLEGDAAGIYVRDASVAEIRDSFFRGNTAFDDGGAIAIDKVGTLATIANCNFTLNEAGASGGGLFVEDSLEAALDVSDCTFDQNFISDPPTGTPNDFDAPGDGGGAFITGIGGPSVDVGFRNCFFLNNTAPDDGGGLVIVGVSDGSLPNPGQITLNNNIFEGNVAVGTSLTLTLNHHLYIYVVDHLGQMIMPTVYALRMSNCIAN